MGLEKGTFLWFEHTRDLCYQKQEWAARQHRHSKMRDLGMSLLSIHGDVLFDTVSPPAGLSDDLSLLFQNAQVISFLFFPSSFSCFLPFQRTNLSSSPVAFMTSPHTSLRPTLPMTRQHLRSPRIPCGDTCFSKLQTQLVKAKSPSPWSLPPLLSDPIWAGMPR